MIPIDTDPATPIVPAAAPDVVSVSNVLVTSDPFTVSSAESTTPTELTFAVLPICARFVTVTRLTATAAPTPSVPASVAEPSAVALPSAFCEELSVKTPPATMESPLGSVAVADAVWMLIEIAAATSTDEPPESEVVALGVVRLAGVGGAVRAGGAVGEAELAVRLLVRVAGVVRVLVLRARRARDRVGLARRRSRGRRR